MSKMKRGSSCQEWTEYLNHILTIIILCGFISCVISIPHVNGSRSSDLSLQSNHSTAENFSQSSPDSVIKDDQRLFQNRSKLYSLARSRGSKKDHSRTESMSNPVDVHPAWIQVHNPDSLNDLRRYDSDQSFHHIVLDSATGDVLSTDHNSIYRMSTSLKLVDRLSLKNQMIQNCSDFNNQDGFLPKTAARDQIVLLHIPSTEYFLHCDICLRYCSIVSVKPLRLISVLDKIETLTLAGLSTEFIKHENQSQQFKIFVAKSSSDSSVQQSFPYTSIFSKSFSFSLQGNISAINVARVNSGKEVKEEAAAEILHKEKGANNSDLHLDKISEASSAEVPSLSVINKEHELFLNFSKATEKFNYTIQYVYGFRNERYVYWLTVQRDSLHAADNYDTRLVRVCQDDKHAVKSYSEIQLSCRKKISISRHYNIAQAGVLGTAEKDVANRFKLDEERKEDILYVLMGRSKPGKSYAEEEYGMGICMYLMGDIVKSFNKAERECYMGHGKTAAWLNNGSQECKNMGELAALSAAHSGIFSAGESLSDDVLDKLLPGITTRYPLNSDTNYTSDSRLGTSLAVLGQNGNTVAFIGTSRGHLLKVKLDGLNSQPLLDLNLASGQNQSYPVSQLILNPSAEFLYAVTGTRITRVPISSCSLYVDCTGCLLSSDPLGCGWCGTRCSTRHHCPVSVHWSDSSCPPVVHSFKPQAGPVQGGTRLSLVGLNFDVDQQNDPVSRRSEARVRVGDLDCHIEFRNSTSLICVTMDTGGSEINREISVAISELPVTMLKSNLSSLQTKRNGVVISGTSNTGFVSYVYKIAEVKSFHPLVGGKSGGTIISIYGSNLNIGSKLSVSVASQPCALVSITENILTCRTSSITTNTTRLLSSESEPRFESLRQNYQESAEDPSKQTESENDHKMKNAESSDSINGRNLITKERLTAGDDGSIFSGPVIVRIDDAVLSVPNTDFHYHEDPVVTEVYTRGSILSGGMLITVRGHHLQTVQQPLVRVWTEYDAHPFMESCKCDPTGREMLCRTPNLTLTSGNVTLDTPLSTQAVIFFKPDQEDLSVFDLESNSNISDITLPISDPATVVITLVYYLNPVIARFAVETVGQAQKAIKPFYRNENYLEIKGNYLDLVAESADYKVTVENFNCVVTQLLRNSLFCEPSKSSAMLLVKAELSVVAPGKGPANKKQKCSEIKQKQKFTNKLTESVLVKVGNVEVSVGSLMYTEKKSDWLFTWITIPIMSLLCILSFLLLLWIRKSCRCLRSWKTFGKQNLAVSYIHIPDQRDQNSRLQRGYFTGGALPSASVINNAYWLNWQPSNNEQSMNAPQPGETVLNADSWQLVYDSNIFIPRENLVLMDVIGQGHFGCVYRGVILLDETLDRQIAVKTLKGLQGAYGGNGRHISVSAGEVRKFLDEALTMREFDHPHVLSLIGVSMDKDRLPLVVLPYLRHGDLLTYIRNENNSPTVKDLMVFGIQISEGMSYLASLKFVHRDLAARNCMLDDTMKVKVADFGLSRDIYEREYYSSDNRRSKLPVKWMAPESLEMGIYTTKSDVWSYGVVLWELMTRGVCPYPEVDNWDIVKFLSTGRRMAQPLYCPDPLYAIMLKCWHPDAKARPVFDNLGKKIKEIIASMETATAAGKLSLNGKSASLENLAECRKSNRVLQYSNVVRWSDYMSAECLTSSDSTDIKPSDSLSTIDCNDFIVTTV